MSTPRIKRDLLDSIALLGPFYAAPAVLGLLINGRVDAFTTALAVLALSLGALLASLPRPLALTLKIVHGLLAGAALLAAGAAYVLLGAAEAAVLALCGALLVAGYAWQLIRKRAAGRPLRTDWMLLPCLLPLARALYIFDEPAVMSLAPLALLLPLIPALRREWSPAAVLACAWWITLMSALALFHQGNDTLRFKRVLTQPGVTALYTYFQEDDLSRKMGRGARYIERLPDNDLLAFTIHPGPFLYRLDGRPPHPEKARLLIHSSDQVMPLDEHRALLGLGSSPAELDLQRLFARRLSDSRPGHICDLIGPINGHVLFGYDWLRSYFGDLDLAGAAPRYVPLPGRWYNFWYDNRVAWVSVLSLDSSKHGLYEYDPTDASLKRKVAGLQGSLRLDEHYAYVIDPFSPDLTRIDRATGETQQLNLGLATRSLWLDPQRGLLAVSGFLDGRLWLIDGRAMRILRVLQTGGRVRWISHDPTNDSLIVCSNVGGIVIDLKVVLAAR